MEEKQVPQDSDLLAWMVELVDKLGPFKGHAPREDKWRTTEQLAHDICKERNLRIDVDRLTKILNEHENNAQERMKNGLKPCALIRRATYPDRTTALPLWGSTKHHKQPWPGQAQQEKSDEPGEIPNGRRVSGSAPYVFMSHTRQDEELAIRLACSLATIDIGTWMFETDIAYKSNIAASVRDALQSTSGCISLVTRNSIASLWVLTELYTVRQMGKAVTLIINTDDELLTGLFKSIQFSHNRQDFDFSIQYDKAILAELSADYKERINSITRADRYTSQTHDFLKTLPYYLAGQPALAYPDLPKNWQGSIQLATLNNLQSRLEKP